MRMTIGILVAALLFASESAAQQFTTGVIQGTVTDTTGDSIPGVSVEARHLETNQARTVTSGSDGRYILLQLPPGTYRVTFTLPGFASHVQENVVLTIGQSITLPIAMKVAGVAETVTVRTSPRVIESTRTSAATTLDERTVETLPILGRKFEDLLTLTPGVSIVQGPDGDEITFAGQRGIFNNISLDGGDYNNGFFGEQAGGQRAAIDITLDAVKEFQVIATGAPAEFGRTAGGVVNVITKSGTNTPHGSLFYFQRLESLTGELSDGTNLDGFHREQFGGTFGGPIKTDKAFFFGAVEGITGNFSRPNLGRQLGDTACPVANPTVPQNEALINGNADCQRTALLSFFNTRLGMDESLPIEHPVQTVAVLGKLDITASPKQQSLGLVELQPLAQGERDVRRGDLRHVGERHRRRPGPHQRRQPELVHDALGPRAERGALHLLAREPAADRGRIEPGRRYRHGLRADLPVRQPVLPAACRRRADLAHADQGQPLDRPRRAHHQGRRRMDAHAERSGVPRLLHRPLHLRQRDRVPPLRVAGGVRRLRAADRRLSQRGLRHRARSPVRAAALRRTVRCCSTCRARA